MIADKLGVKLLGEGVYKAFKTTGGRVPVVGPILGVYAALCMMTVTRVQLKSIMVTCGSGMRLKVTKV